MSEEAPKLRLKPRLIADTSAAPAAAPTASPANPVASPSAHGDQASPAAPDVASEPAANETAPKPKILLRPRADIAPPPALAVVAASPATASSPSRLPPAEPPPLPVTAIGPGVSAQDVKKVQLAALSIGLVGVVVFSLIGAIAYPRVMAQVKAWNAAESEADPADSTVPTDADDSPATAGAPASVAPAANPSRPSHTAASNPAPATEAPPSPSAVSDGAVDFRAWVNGLKINGVRGGAVPRVLIGGTSYKQGDVVHPELGITFDGYDAQRHRLRFRDRNGAVVERRDR